MRPRASIVFANGCPAGRSLEPKACSTVCRQRLSGILDSLTRRGALSEADVDAAMREVRRALLEADVALDVARGFIDRVRERAVGVDVIKSVTPGQMVVKIVHDELVDDARLGRRRRSISMPRRRSRS